MGDKEKEKNCLHFISKKRFGMFWLHVKSIDMIEVAKHNQLKIIEKESLENYISYALRTTMKSVMTIGCD